MKQSTSNLLMIRPAAFQYNAETAVSNRFQSIVSTMTNKQILVEAVKEFDAMVEKLEANKINVEVIQDTPDPVKPDAIFPNNWLSMGHEGILTVFPMKNKNRRVEKRKDILDRLDREYIIKRKIDLSEYEDQDRALEGTGSIVFDHNMRIAYACLSPRTDEEILKNYCQQIGYEPVVFHSYDSNNQPIYHTNVVMSVGSGYVVIGLDSVIKNSEIELLESKFKSSGLEIIKLTEDQLLKSFAGNMLQVENKDGDLFLVMSKSAHDSLSSSQIESLEKYVKLLPVSIDIIETVGGGSARCMMAENFFEKK